MKLVGLFLNETEMFFVFGRDIHEGLLEFSLIIENYFNWLDLFSRKSLNDDTCKPLGPYTRGQLSAFGTDRELHPAAFFLRLWRRGPNKIEFFVQNIKWNYIRVQISVYPPLENRSFMEIRIVLHLFSLCFDCFPRRKNTELLFEMITEVLVPDKIAELSMILKSLF